MQAKVLDHGYVELVTTWGSDEQIIEAARMSTNKGFQGWGPKPCPACGGSGMTTTTTAITDLGDEIPLPKVCWTCNMTGQVSGDEKLLKYLYDHKHMTPFEMAGMTIEVQAPIFVFREWHRHRTQSYNELSARYTPMPDLNYVPTVERLLLNGGTNKQAQGTGKRLDDINAVRFNTELRAAYEHAENVYQDALARGVPKELARLCIPVGRYSRMRASANLRNWLAFLTLRMDPAAQWEIRQYANAVADLIAEKFPRTWQLFNVTGPTITKA